MYRRAGQKQTKGETADLIRPEESVDGKSYSAAAGKRLGVYGIWRSRGSMLTDTKDSTGEPKSALILCLGRK